MEGQEREGIEGGGESEKHYSQPFSRFFFFYHFLDSRRRAFFSLNHRSSKCDFCLGIQELCRRMGLKEDQQ